MMYTVQVTFSDTSARQIKLHNLSAVWGFLCGVIPRYHALYPTIERFRAWWTAARKRGSLTKSVDGIRFEVTI